MKYKLFDALIVRDAVEKLPVRCGAHEIAVLREVHTEVTVLGPVLDADGNHVEHDSEEVAGQSAIVGVEPKEPEYATPAQEMARLERQYGANPENGQSYVERALGRNARLMESALPDMEADLLRGEVVEPEPFSDEVPAPVKAKRGRPARQMEPADE